MVTRYSRLRHNKYRTYKILSSKLLFALKVSATLQDRQHAGRCSVSCFYKNPYKPYIF